MRTQQSVNFWQKLHFYDFCFLFLFPSSCRLCVSLSFFFSISLRTSPPLFFFYSGSSLPNHRPPRNLSLSWLSMLDVQSGLSLPQHLYTIFRLFRSSSKYYFLESDWRAHSTHVQTFSAARRSVVDTKIWRNMDVHTEPAQTPADDEIYGTSHTWKI